MNIFQLLLLVPLAIVSITAANFSSFPHFAVEPNDVYSNDGTRSAVFTCLLSQSSLPPGALIPPTITWFYNSRQVDSVTDKIRIPLANGSLYVSAAAIENPPPYSPTDNVPLPKTQGYNCRASTKLDYDGSEYDAIVVSHVAHVRSNSPSPAAGTRPHRLPVRIGDVAVLACGQGAATNGDGHAIEMAGAAVGDSYVWFRDDEPFAPESGVLDNGRVIEFSAVLAHDFGDYACAKASQPETTISRFLVTKHRGSLPELESSLDFLILPTDSLIKADNMENLPEAVTVFCSAAGYAGSAVDVAWLKNGALIDFTKNEGKFKKIGRGSLKMLSPSQNDSGLYTCRASLTIADTTMFIDANVYVTIAVSPKICPAHKGEVNVAPTTGSIGLNCGIERALDVFWFHNGKFLSPEKPELVKETTSRRYFYDYSTKNNAENCGSTLQLWALTQSDSGVYQCFGVNQAGLVSSVQFLAVDHSTSLYVFNSTDNKIGEFSSPAATAIRDDLAIDRMKRPKNVRIISQSPTTFQATWDEPDLSKDSTISGYVVLLRSTVSDKVRRLFAPHAEILVDRLTPGKSYELTAAVVFKSKSHSSLIVGALSRPMEVKTNLASKFQESPLQLLKKEKKIPSKPKNIKAVIRSPTTIDVAWAPPSTNPHQRSSTSTRSLSNRGVNRYRLFYRSDHQNDAYVDLPGHQTSHVLTSLQPNTPYTFYVRAGMVDENESVQHEATQLVLGPASRDITVWTPSTAPTGSPKDVKALASAPATISVQWKAPDAELQNGLITGYKVVYQSKSSKQQKQLPFAGRAILTDGVTTAVELTEGIAPNTDYEIRVAAINVNGTGPLSEGVYVSTPQQQLTESITPGAPFGFVAQAASSSQILLTWQPPSSSGTVVVRGYYISYGVGEPYRNQVVIDAAKTKHVLTDLRPSSEYIISLRSYNNYGYGPEVFQAVRTPQLKKTAEGSRELSLRTFDAKLSKKSDRTKRIEPLKVPLGVKASALSDSTMIISWTDPNDHEMIRSRVHVTYTVRYSATDDQGSALEKGRPPPQKRWRSVNSTLPSIRVHSLKPWQEYEFVVRIVRSGVKNGREQVSDWSMSTTNRTLEAPPSDSPIDVKVTEVPAVAVRGPAVRVSWQPPRKPNGIITSYVVFYSDRDPRSERDWQVIGVGGDRYSVLIRRLKHDANYYFKVQAKTRRGYGPASMPPVHIRTPPVRGSVLHVVDSDSLENPSREFRVGNGQGGNWNYDNDFFEKELMPTMTSKFSDEGTTIHSVIFGGNELDAAPVTNPTTSTLWLAISAAIGALVVCAVISTSLFICRRVSSSESGSKNKKMHHGKGDNGRGKQNGKMPPSDLGPANNSDMWAMREQMELRQQLMSAADGATNGMQCLAVSEENLLNTGEPGSVRHHSVTGNGDKRSHQLYHIDPYENETIIIGSHGDGLDPRQTSSSIICSPSTAHPGTLSYRHQRVAAANARLFNSRTSSSVISSCQESYPLLNNGHHQQFRHAPPSTSGVSIGDGEEYLVDSNPAALSTARIGSVMSYRASPATSNSTEHQHALHKTLPRLSIATMPSPTGASMHRYEPLLTTTSGTTTSSSHMFMCPPSAHTPDSGCDIEHHQMLQRQRTSLSSSSYGGGGGSVSSSTTNNIASLGSNRPTQASNQGEQCERPRLSSFQPLPTSSIGNTPNAMGSNSKASVLHLSRVLPPTPGQVRSTIALNSSQPPSTERTSSVAISSVAQSAADGITSASVGVISMPPAPPDLQSTATTDEELAAAELSCLDGLMKDLRLDVATSSSATLTNGCVGSNGILTAAPPVKVPSH